MPENQNSEYLKIISKLEKDLKDINEEQEEMMKYFNFVALDLTFDMRIIQTSGPISTFFKNYDGNVERGDNLIKVIHKFTHNTKIRSENNEYAKINNDDLEDLESTILRFIQGGSKDKEIEMLGESDEGEKFLLNIYLVKKEKYYNGYLKITYSNAIVRKNAEVHEQKINTLKKNINDIYDLVHDGILMINLNGKIMFMNEASRNFWINQDNPLFKNTSFVGRFFHEIFANEDTDKVKMMQDKNKQVIIDKKPVTYTRTIRDKEAEYIVNPMFGNPNKLSGLVIVSRFKSELAPQKTVDNKKILYSLKKLTEENQILREELSELETNQNWLMKNSKNFQLTIKTLYSIINELPLPIAVYSYPDQVYEIINKSFETFSRMKRKSIVGKTDKEILDEKIVSSIIKHTKNTNIESKSEEISSEKIKIIQTYIKDNSQKPIKLLRLFINF